MKGDGIPHLLLDRTGAYLHAISTGCAAVELAVRCTIPCAYLPSSRVVVRNRGARKNRER